MITRRPTWQPRYTLTPVIAGNLMEIESARAVVEHTPLPPAVEAKLRHRTQVRSTGWLVVVNPSYRARAYTLSAAYRQYIGRLSAMPRNKG